MNFARRAAHRCDRAGATLHEKLGAAVGFELKRGDECAGVCPAFFEVWVFHGRMSVELRVGSRGTQAEAFGGRKRLAREEPGVRRPDRGQQLRARTAARVGDA